ncbi:MAG TPA: hypothetical protein VHN13_06435 [Candidatus Tectomicrobia bacterium]|nr:hypothetical protein [Candidatus Tectomicrobia bacterium]
MDREAPYGRAQRRQRRSTGAVREALRQPALQRLEARVSGARGVRTLSQGGTVSRRWVRGVSMAMTLAMASCASWPAQYLKGAVNHATTEAVEKHLGRPHETWELRTGESLWTYQSGVPSGTDAGGLTIVGPDWVLGKRSHCTQSVLLFDQRKILRAWMQQPCRPARETSRAPAAPQAPAPSPTETDPRSTPDRPSPPS